MTRSGHSPGKRPIMAFTLYPRWWQRFPSACAQEWFFRELPLRLEREAPFAFAAWITSWPTDLILHRRRVRREHQRGRIHPLQSSLRPFDLLALLHPRLGLARRRFRKRFSSRITSQVAGFEIGPLLATEIERSLASRELFRNVLIARAMRRTIELSTPRALIYRLEFQPIEHAIVGAARGLCPTVGFQHSSFGRNYLPYVFPKGVLAPDDQPDTIPRPDHIFATGSFSADMICEGGFPRERMRVVGAVRYSRLRKALKNGHAPVARPSEPMDAPGLPRIFVATSVAAGDNVVLLRALRDASSRIGAANVRVKPHPTTPLPADLLQAVRGAYAGGSLDIDPSADIYDEIKAADVVVLTGSTIAFEAIALGVVPIVVEAANTFSAKSLVDFHNAVFIVRDGDDLAAAVAATINDSPELNLKRKVWPDVIRAVFDDLESDPEGRFIDELARAGIIAKEAGA